MEGLSEAGALDKYMWLGITSAPVPRRESPLHGPGSKSKFAETSNSTKLSVFETTRVHASIRLLGTPICMTWQRVTLEAYEGKTALTSTWSAWVCEWRWKYKLRGGKREAVIIVLHGIHQHHELLLDASPAWTACLVTSYLQDQFGVLIAYPPNFSVGHATNRIRRQKSNLIEPTRRS